MALYYITSNKRKFEEAKEIMPGLEWFKKDIDEIQSLDPKEIINAKIREASKYCKNEFIVEDVSVSMECLNGLPGTMIKWFLKALGTDGIYKIAENFGVFGASCSIVIGYSNKGEINLFEGKCDGKLVKPAKNAYDFWDDLFMPGGYDKTFADMPLDQKNAISHRAVALNKLRQFLVEQAKD